MNPIVVYHWWSFPEEPPVYSNLRTPILTSIATLRAVSDAEIYVLDCSEHKNEWGEFPKKLNFQVCQKKCSFANCQNLIDGWRHLSRIPDIHHWSSQKFFNQNIVYVDSDVFFFKNPFPLSCNTDKFCWDGWNTGYFYFNTESDHYKKFYELFESYCKSAIHSEEIRNLIKNYAGYDAWYGVWDEMILEFMKSQHPNLFNFIPIDEHTTSRNLISSTDPKIFHANGSMMENPLTGEKHARGLLGLMISEFYEKLEKILSPEELNLMYGKYLNYFQEKRFSLLENACFLEMNKDEQGHFHMNQMIKQIQFV